MALGVHVGAMVFLCFPFIHVCMNVTSIQIYFRLNLPNPSLMRDYHCISSDFLHTCRSQIRWFEYWSVLFSSMFHPYLKILHHLGIWWSYCNVNSRSVPINTSYVVWCQLSFGHTLLPTMIFICVCLVFPCVSLLAIISCFNTQVFLMLLILLTGNYNFFNLLTIVLSLSLCDDNFLRRCLFKKALRKEHPSVC